MLTHLSARLVNECTRVLHDLLTHYAPQINLQQKLSAIPNGSGVHKHLVTLTRLAFSEGLVLEAGLAAAVVEAAHHMLEDCVTPEEGEALLGAFASARI